MSDSYQTPCRHRDRHLISTTNQPVNNRQTSAHKLFTSNNTILINYYKVKTFIKIIYFDNTSYTINTTIDLQIFCLTNCHTTVKHPSKHH